MNSIIITIITDRIIHEIHVGNTTECALTILDNLSMDEDYIEKIHIVAKRNSLIIDTVLKADMVSTKDVTMRVTSNAETLQKYLPISAQGIFCSNEDFNPVRTPLVVYGLIAVYTQ